MDRWEGIKASRPVSGGLYLVSAKILTTDILDESPRRVSLGFVLNSASRVTITVRLPRENYWMEPIDGSGRKGFEGREGFNRFSWSPRAVTTYLKRDVSTLNVLAEPNPRTGPRVVIPVVLYDPGVELSDPLLVSGYEFAFFPRAAVEILKYEFQSAPGEVIFADDVTNFPDNRVINIPWAPRDAPDGLYKLLVNAVYPVHNQPPATQNVIVEFEHKSSIGIARTPTMQ